MFRVPFLKKSSGSPSSASQDYENRRAQFGRQRFVVDNKGETVRSYSFRVLEPYLYM
jgi:hypothetical protein